MELSRFKPIQDKEVTEEGGPSAQARKCFEVLKLSIFLSTNIWLSFLYLAETPPPPSPTTTSLPKATRGHIMVSENEARIWHTQC